MPRPGGAPDAVPPAATVAAGSIGEAACPGRKEAIVTRVQSRQPTAAAGGCRPSAANERSDRCIPFHFGLGLEEVSGSSRRRPGH
jgi:hypothetical protein